jgi:hypothetical protein
VGRVGQEDEQGRQGLPGIDLPAEGRRDGAEAGDGRLDPVLADGWAAPGWRDAAAEYHATRGRGANIVELEPERLRRLRRLLDDSVNIDRAYREINANRPTPQVTIEAVVVAVRERGVKALTEPDMLRRLGGCDKAARDEINRRVAALLRETPA